MTSSTVENLTDIATAAPAGIQTTDLFYVFRPGAPDADFRADGGDLQTAVLGATVSVTAAGRALLDDADAAAQRTTLGLVIGTNVQAYDGTLAGLAGVTTAADKLIYATGLDTFATADFTSTARSLLDDTSIGAMAATLGLGTGDSPQFTAVNVGHASDTTLARTSAGIMNVEGVNLVGGTTGSTDNCVLRADGTNTVKMQSTGVTIDDNDAIYGYKAILNAQTGTTYTLVSGDSGKVVRCTNASAITVTLPNSLAEGFVCEIIQGGAGQVTLSAASGAAINNRSSHTKIAGQYGAVRLVVVSNSGGAAATYNLAGDTGA